LSNENAAAFGFHTQSEFIGPNAATEHGKIDALNNKIKELENEEALDVPIIQLPGGMIRFREIETCKHGIYAYMWAQAITPDHSILCSPHLMFEPEKAASMSEIFKHRFGLNEGIFRSPTCQFAGELFDRLLF
jgi:hypothetical protein